MTLRASHFINKLTLLLCLCVAAACPAHAEIRDVPSLTVLAPTSMATPLSELARDYARQENITVMTSFLNNRQQWEVIQDGDAADVIITDDPSVIRRLKRQGLMDVFTSNRWLDEALFVITPASWDDTPEPLPNFEQDITLPWRDDSSQPSFVPRMTSAQLRDTTSSETRVFLELHKHLRSWLSQGPIYILSPEGSYTDSLTQLSLDLLRLPNSTSTQLAWFEHPEPLVRRFHDAPGTIIAPESSLRTIRAMLPNNSAVRGELPLPSNQPLTLFVAVVAGEHMSIARNFVDYLKSDHASAVMYKKNLQKPQ